MKIKKSTDVRKYFQETIDAIHYTHEPTLICKNGKPWVIIQPLTEDHETLKKLVARAFNSKN